MGNKILISLVFLFTSLCVYAKTIDEVEFSVITIGPYENELYSAFGHSGIRFNDKNNGTDYFYNYGIFDFDQPNFYLNFLNGKLLYMVGKYDFPLVEEFYKSQNRYIKEQVLNLDESEKILLYNYLEQNIRPENREYLYNYVYNNCATKIRDVLVSILGERLKFDNKTESKSFRNFMDMYLENNKWGDLGIDICLGPTIDNKLSYSDQMFLPEYLHSALENATLDNNKKLVSKSNVYIPDKKEAIKSFLQPSVIFFLVLLLSLYLSFKQIKYGIKFIYFDSALFFITGLVGILIFYLWFFTDHLSTNNFNLVWAFPLNFFLSFLIIKRYEYNWITKYMIVYAAFLIATLLMWNFIPQELNKTLIFLLIAILLRLFSNVIHVSRIKNLNRS